MILVSSEISQWDEYDSCSNFQIEKIQKESKVW